MDFFDHASELDVRLRGAVGSLVVVIVVATGTSTPVGAAAIPACRSAQLRTVAYGTGLAAGTEYLAIAVTNSSARACRIGTTVALLTFDGHRFRRLASEVTTPTFGEPVSVLRPRDRPVCQSIPVATHRPQIG